jgi:hypothetical protein
MYEMYGTEETRHTSCHYVGKAADKNMENNKFCEELVIYFPFI